MKKRTTFVLVVVTLMCLVVSPWPINAAELLILAGSASKPVLEQAVTAFGANHPASITLILGGSGSMLSQVQLTGRGDLYLPGSHDYLGKAISLGLIATGTETTFAYLVPAICVPKANPAHIKNLSDLGLSGVRVGIGHPKSVCVGLYAVEIIQRAGLTDKIKPNIVAYLTSCAKVANAAAIGSVDAVLGWRAFGAWAPDKITVIPLQASEILRVATLGGGVLTTAKEPKLARAFLQFLASEDGQSIYKSCGYLTSIEALRIHAASATVGGLFNLPDAWH